MEHDSIQPVSVSDIGALTATLEALPDAVVVTDEAGIIVAANGEAARLLGYAAAELVGFPVEILVPRNLRAVHRQHRAGYAEAPLVRAMGHGADLRASRKDGSEFSAEISLSPIATDAGRLVISVIRNVEGRRADLERAFLAAVLDSSDDAIVGIDLDGSIVSWNRGAERLYGRLEDGVLGQPFDLLAPPDDVAALREKIAAVGRGRHAPPGEARRVRGDGCLVAVDVTVSPVRHNGAVVGVTLVERDIEDRKRAEAALRASDARARALLQNQADVVALLDRCGNYTYVSPAVERALGWPPAAFVGQRIAGHPAAVNREQILAAFDRAVAGGPDARVGFDLELRRPDGEPRAFDAELTNLLDDPDVGGVVLNCRDVTDRVRAAAESRRAKDAAEAANRAKSIFLRMMSHELRTPLTAVIGYGDLLLAGVSGPLTEAQAEDIGRITAAGAHLLALVNDVLDLAGIESGALRLSPERLDLGRLAREVHDAIAPSARRKGLGLSLDGDGGDHAVVGDPVRLRQALLVLADNAVKFTTRGAVRFEVRRTAEGCAVAVSDTGIGIHPDNFEIIFDGFAQVEEATTRRYGGAGVGLTLARSLVAMQGGTIAVASTPGRGSTFTLTLPAAADLPPDLHA